MESIVKGVKVHCDIIGDFMLPDHVAEAIISQGNAIGVLIGNQAKMDGESKGEFFIQFRVTLNPVDSRTNLKAEQDEVDNFEEIFEVTLPQEIRDRVREENKYNPWKKENLQAFLKFFGAMKKVDPDFIKAIGKGIANDLSDDGLQGLLEFTL